jgi:hypothetical protein
MRAPFFSPYPVYYALFRRRLDGDWDFFPYLRWGRGYRVNAMQRTELIDSMLRYDLGLAVSLSIVFAVVALALTNLITSGGGLADAILFVLFMGLVGVAVRLRFRSVRRLVENLPPAETVLKAGEEYALWAAQLPKPAILLMAILGLLGCIGTVAALLYELRSGEWSSVPLLIVTAGGSGMIAWYYAQTWRHRGK